MLKDNKSKFKQLFSWFNSNKKLSVQDNEVNENILKISKIPKNDFLDCSTQHINETVVLDKKESSIINSQNADIKNVKSIVSSCIKVKKEGMFLTLVKKLSKTKKHFGSKIYNLFSKKKVNSSIFEEISEQLLIADVGLNTTDKLINYLEKEVRIRNIQNSKVILSLLKRYMVDILKKVEKPLTVATYRKPFSILMVGVNGVGKTSIIGKLAYSFKNQGKSVMLAAGDTFRAAAIDQLEILGKKNAIPVISQKCGSDPAAVVFDALKSAQSKNVDIVIADTAGRLHNKINLMEELKKIKRVMKKLDCSAPNEIMLVLDACIGQNSINQAEIFNKALGVTGLVITKLDGTSKGGVIFTIANKLSIPIRYISFGEKEADMHCFNSENFVNAIFSEYS
ncbi:MAG: signal recognition particle-docking protein FtsY [Buchnera aphidicola (Meitanaphis elongallis)]